MKNAEKEFLEAIAPMLQFILPLSPDQEGKARLEKRFPIEGQEMQDLKSMVRRGVEEGWLCNKEHGGIRFSRPVKATEDMPLSVDAVSMDKPGPGHTHPGGEFDLCFAVSGTPLFDGEPEGWTVYEAGSWHVPTVTEGKMDILYFLPKGAIEFGPNPNA